jgi:hypothetical protein
MQDGYKKGVQAQSVLENAQDTSERLDVTMTDGAGYSWAGQIDTTQESSWHNPCKNKNVNLSTLYQQQRCYFITKKKDLTCPLILFRRHLVKQLQQRQAVGEKILLFMDHNKHVIDGAIGKALADRDGLDLREAILHHTGRSPGAMFFRGSKPIDELWISSNVDVSNACVMPFGYGVGNHCTFILDIPIESLVGLDPVKIVRPASQQLNSRLPGCSKAYCDSLENNIIRNCLLEWLHDTHTGGYLAEEKARRVIIIDEEGKAYMRRAEKICQKKVLPHPVLAGGLNLDMPRPSLLLTASLSQREDKNHGNLKCSAQWCNIPNPLSSSIQEIALHLEACKRECAFYQEHGKWFCRKHPENRKRMAKDQDDEEAFNKTCAIIQREQQQNF